MNLKPNAQREKKEMYESASPLTKALKNPIILHHRLRKLLAGGYHQKPFQYQIYTASNLEKRKSFDVAQPSGRWNPYVPKAVSATDG